MKCYFWESKDIQLQGGDSMSEMQYKKETRTIIIEGISIANIKKMY